MVDLVVLMVGLYDPRCLFQLNDSMILRFYDKGMLEGKKLLLWCVLVLLIRPSNFTWFMTQITMAAGNISRDITLCLLNLLLVF